MSDGQGCGFTAWERVQNSRKAVSSAEEDWAVVFLQTRKSPTVGAAGLSQQGRLLQAQHCYPHPGKIMAQQLRVIETATGALTLSSAANYSAITKMTQGAR
jgi:hypothetical protein